MGDSGTRIGCGSGMVECRSRRRPSRTKVNGPFSMPPSRDGQGCQARCSSQGEMMMAAKWAHERMDAEGQARMPSHGRGEHGEWALPGEGVKERAGS